MVNGVERIATVGRGDAGVGISLPPGAPMEEGFEPDPLHPDTGIGAVSWQEVERLYEVETWILGPDGYPLFLTNPSFGGDVLDVEWSPHKTPPFTTFTTGRPPYLKEEQREYRTWGRLRTDQVTDIVEVVHDLDLTEWSTPRPPRTTLPPPSPPGPAKVLRLGRRR